MHPVDLIDAQLLKIGCPENSAQQLAGWVSPIKRACLRFDITRVRRIAGFIAQCGHESCGFTRMQESLNYSVRGLVSNFGRHRISLADADRYGRKSGQAADQEALANILYGGDWGRKHLGNTQPGDGWAFRGYGLIHLTGRGNWTKFARAMGITVGEALAYARTNEGAAMSAGWFWHEYGLNALADTPGITDETRRINGGEKGLEDRRTRFNALVDELLRRGA